MKHFTIALALIMATFFSGCATSTHSSQNVGQISRIHYGKVIHVASAVISDSGLGALGGAALGGLAGSTIGKGRGQTLAIVGGALAGGVGGSQLNQQSGQELTILLDSGEELSTVISNKSSGISFRPGDLVSVRIQNGTITRIDLR
ncbi:MAG: glycine zipper 2TM domain-containing protein [Campylobacteraceae bacterium]|nr:glycine zipper 2TM domain-containing protein [Campylobacteraceae bacterium]